MSYRSSLPLCDLVTSRLPMSTGSAWSHADAACRWTTIARIRHKDTCSCTQSPLGRCGCRGRLSLLAAQAPLSDDVGVLSHRMVIAYGGTGQSKPTMQSDLITQREWYRRLFLSHAKISMEALATEMLETDDSLPLPTAFAIHDCRIMERFCLAVEEDDRGSG